MSLGALVAGSTLYGPGGTLFRWLPVGAYFRFAQSDRLYRKTGQSGWHRDQDGRAFRIGGGTYVFPDTHQKP